MKKREIFIELTSLLDVILIMLFVLLSQAKLSSDEALEAAQTAESSIAVMQQELDGQKAALNEAQKENDELRDSLSAYQRNEITLGVVEENSLIVTVSVQNRDARCILVEQKDSGSVTVALDGENMNYSANKLRSTLNNMMQQAGVDTVFVVFQYDRGSIYQSEYQLIGNVVRELKAEAKALDIHMNYIETDIITQ